MPQSAVRQTVENVDVAVCRARAEEAALAAGRMLTAARQSAVVEATRRDLKLDVDSQAEQRIIELLGNELPILGEEGGWTACEGRACWVVDALDGSVNFHYGIPLATVSIALVCDGAPLVGVVYDFSRDELFSGVAGQGVTCNGQPVQVRPACRAEEALCLSALATAADFSPDALASFGQRLGRWRKVRMLGSAALSLAYVAAGRADACELASIMRWDVAAGIALVKAAGGAVACRECGDNVVDVIAGSGDYGAPDGKEQAL